MSIDPLAFLDEPPSLDEQSDPLAFLDKSENSFRKPARYAAQAAKGALNLIPPVANYNFATTLQREASHRSRQRITEQSKKALQVMDEKLAKGESLTRKERMFYDRTKRWAERKNEKNIPIDTESLINKGVKSATGVDLEPEDLGESITNIGASLFNPRVLINNVQKLPQLITKSGRAALSAEKAVTKAKSSWESLEKAFKGNPEKQGLLNFAKKNDLSPEAATLLIQSKGKIDAIGKIAKKTKKFKGAVEELNQNLGANYEKLKSLGREGGYLGGKQTESLADDLRKMSNKMDKTLIKGPDTKFAQAAIEEALLKLEMEGATIGDLVNTRINLGQQINWGNIDPKGAMLNEGRDIFLKAIEKSNPRVADELRLTDKAWAQYQKYADLLDKKQAFVRIHGIPIPTGNIAFGVGLKLALGMNPATAAKYALAKEGIQRLSTALLTNPNLQGVHKRLLQAVLSGNTEAQRKLMIIAQKTIKKEDPELYNELGIED